MGKAHAAVIRGNACMPRPSSIVPSREMKVMLMETSASLLVSELDQGGEEHSWAQGRQI